MRNASPAFSAATSTLAFGKSVFHVPPSRSATSFPVPASPPCNPHGLQWARSIWVFMVMAVRARTTRSTPSPPRGRPAPPGSPAPPRGAVGGAAGAAVTRHQPIALDHEGKLRLRLLIRAVVGVAVVDADG